MNLLNLKTWLERISARDEIEIRVQMEDGVCLPCSAFLANFWEEGEDGRYGEVPKIILEAKWPDREDEPDPGKPCSMRRSQAGGERKETT